LVVLLAFGCSRKSPDSQTVPAPTQPARATASATNDIATQITNKLQALRKLGYPVTPEDLHAWLPTPPSDGENAAFLWTNAFAALVPRQRPVPPLPESHLPFSNASRSYYKKFVTTNRIAIDRMQKAATLHLCRFPSSTNYESHDVVWETGDLLQAEAMLNAEHQPDGSIRTLQIMSALATALRQNLDTGMQMHAGLIWWKACRVAERLLAWNKLTPTQLQSLQNLFHSAQTNDDFRSLCAVELCRGIQSFEYWQNTIVTNLVKFREIDQWVETDMDKPMTPLTPAQITELTEVFAKQKDADFLNYLDAMDEILRASKSPFSEFLRNIQPVVLRFHPDERRAVVEHRIYSTGLIYPLCSFQDGTAETLARLSTAETAMALERFSFDHGSRLPVALAELVPSYLDSVPLDPFDGQPLRYKTVGDCYVIYSIGFNRVDDGGTEGDPRKPPKDVTFSVYKRPRKP
jgi:hypothetical protein